MDRYYRCILFGLIDGLPQFIRIEMMGKKVVELVPNGSDRRQTAIGQTSKAATIVGVSN